MISVLTRIASTFRRFARREDGLMVAEFVLVLPIFLFCTIGMYSYWDAFRTLNSSQKASYNAADMISRTMQPVNEAYLRGLRNVMQYMVNDNLPVTMRVTSVYFDGPSNQYQVRWSRSPYEALPALTTTTMQPMVVNLPVMADGDTVIVMETTVDYRPVIARANIAYLYLDRQEFKQFIVTRPRFVPEVCLVTCP